MRSLLPFTRRRGLVHAVAAAMVAAAGAAACSSSSGKGGMAEDGGSDSAVADSAHADAPLADAPGEGEDAGAESGGGSADGFVLPDAFSLTGPDGCVALGASCLDDSICCSSLCVDGGYSHPPVQQ